MPATNITSKTSVASAFCRLLAERRGVAAIEFALIVPIMFVLFFLTMEFWQALETNKKVSGVASQVGDLVTQQETVTTDDLEAIMEIGAAVLQPYRRSSPTITVTAIQVTNETIARPLVVWSRKLVNGAPTYLQVHETPERPALAWQGGRLWINNIDNDSCELLRLSARSRPVAVHVL